MPCRDGGAYDREDEYQRKLDKKKIAFLEASLCATLTACENMKNYMRNDFSWSLFDWIDYEKAGIKKEELTGWWLKHKREDAARRKKEKEKQDLKVSALSKLTEEERKALGL
jgi:hypothetical protein